MIGVGAAKETNRDVRNDKKGCSFCQFENKW